MSDKVSNLFGLLLFNNKEGKKKIDLFQKKRNGFYTPASNPMFLPLL